MHEYLPEHQTSLSEHSKASGELLQAVVEIQRRLPKARVLYVSATGATEAENLCYMTRLGLWGDQTAFKSKFDFVTMLQKRGVGECTLACHIA